MVTSVYGRLVEPDRSRNVSFRAPVRSSQAYLEELESSDIGRDPRFTNGGWLGIALLVAAALCVAYVGFISAWTLLPLAVAW